MIPTNEPRTAAALIIGNELLTGKIQDANVAALARDLFGLGIALRRVIFCPDEVDVICRDLDALRRDHDYVFTSGGVGPTHDDVTMEAVARAFRQRLVSSPEIEGLLREYFGERCTRRHLRMAEVPEEAQLVTASTGRWPAVKVDNVFILPGLPEIFRRKLPILREHLGGGVPFISKAVATRADEGEVADLLERISDAHPAVSIGSYPRWGDDLVRVVVTFDGRVPEEVDRAMAALIDALPRDQIIDGEIAESGART
ncbi:MAG: molybdopterin-binding protein [Thermoanaerobaculia bacterium]